MGSKKIDAAFLARQIEKILDEDGISQDEFSLRSGLAKSTIYDILEVKKPTAQRATARKIAEGTGRSFRIEGDKVYFDKKTEQVITEGLPVDDEMKEVLDEISKIEDPRRRETILDIITMLSKMSPERVKLVKSILRGIVE